MKKILDLHIHSKYSRACSKHLELPRIAQTCETRGIDVVVTGDFTHPRWVEHMQEELMEAGEGIYKLKHHESATRFLLGTEVACIKKHKGATRRIHHLLFAPDMEVLEKFNRTLDAQGFNLKSDGRPILGITSKDLLSMMKDVDERMHMIPAHAWTPWFGLFGSKSGYDSLEEAYDELSSEIFAIETGLSSDPLMNWRCSWLDGVTLISNSDAHSPQKLGREANVIEWPDNEPLSYDRIFDIIKQEKKDEFLHTIEFYPEEGKYHMDGHRDCDIVMHPRETKKHNGICPSCNKNLVVGVMHRVDDLADRTEEEAAVFAAEQKVPYKSIVPLPEILANTFGCGVATKKVARAYEPMIQKIGNEFYILLYADLKQIEAVAGKEVRQAVERVRQGNIVVKPGYDGVFGTVKVFEDDEARARKQLNTSLS